MELQEVYQAIINGRAILLTGSCQPGNANDSYLQVL